MLDKGVTVNVNVVIGTNGGGGYSRCAKFVTS